MTIVKSNDNNDVLSFIREVHVAKPSDQVVEQILQLITSGKLNPGDMLPPERELTVKFGISRNYVREGIKTLELYGLLKPTQGRGTVVTESGIRGLGGVLKTILRLTRRDLIALVDTRILMETEAARLAALHSDAASKEELRECLDAMWRALEDSDAVVDDIKVHIKIADMSDNSVLAQLIRLITPDIVINYRDFKNAQTRKTFSIHEDIVNAIVAGDSEKAAERMQEHLRYVKKNFQQALEKRNSGKIKN